MQPNEELRAEIKENVTRSLREDVGDGDLTGQLIPSSTLISATIMTRTSMILAGTPWVNEVFAQVDPGIEVSWQYADGDEISAGAVIATLHGPARSLLTAERTALNFLQMLSAAATVTAQHVAAVTGSNCRVLDTRKTIPGLRIAQKYAVRCGGGENHRVGLFDAILIKENHIRSCGGITRAIDVARELHPNMAVEVEVESIAEFEEALAAKAERLLLDNFSLNLLEQAVAINRANGNPPSKLEASGGVTLHDLADIAATGVDYVSVGALTKNVQAIDLSMRFD